MEMAAEGLTLIALFALAFLSSKERLYNVHRRDPGLIAAYFVVIGGAGGVESFNKMRSG